MKEGSVGSSYKSRITTPSSVRSFQILGECTVILSMNFAASPGFNWQNSSKSRRL